MKNKLIYLILLLNFVKAETLIEVYNNKLCILDIKTNLHLEKQGLCPKVSELSYFFNKSRSLDEVIVDFKPSFLSDKFNNDIKIIPYFGQYFNLIDTTMYFKIKEIELDNRLNYILLKNQIVYINDNIYIFNKIKKIEGEKYLAVNQFNFKANQTSKNMFKTISENANNLVYIYDNDF